MADGSQREFDERYMHRTPYAIVERGSGGLQPERAAELPNKCDRAIAVAAGVQIFVGSYKEDRRKESCEHGLHGNELALCPLPDRCNGFTENY